MDKKTVTKELGLSDAVIQRVDNGWVLTTIDWYDDGDDGACIERTAVFEDADIVPVDVNPQAESLSNLIWVAFDDHMQSKHGPGLVIQSQPSRTAVELTEARNITEGYNNKKLKDELDAL